MVNGMGNVDKINTKARTRTKCPICLELILPENHSEHLKFEITKFDEPDSPHDQSRAPRAAAKKAKESFSKRQLHAKSKLSLLAQLMENRNARQKWLDGLIDNMPKFSDSALKLEAPQQATLEQLECPICCENLSQMEEYDRNAHVDRCLRSSEEIADIPREVDEYEWAGQTRVRATAMLSEEAKSFDKIGWSVSKQNEAESDDVNITDDVEDCRPKGSGTYTDQDLLQYMDPTDKTVMALLHPKTGKKRNIDVVEESIDDNLGIDVLISGDVQSGDSNGASRLKPLLTYESISVKMARELTGNSRLIVEALLAKIQELREQNPLLVNHIRKKRQLERSQSTVEGSHVSKCLICIDDFDKPVVSTGCWHVHCESCWLQALAVRRVCPQCQRITCPFDLHRIYL